MIKKDDIRNAKQIQNQTHIGLYRLNHSGHMLAKKQSLLRELKKEHLSPDNVPAYKAFASNNLEDVSQGTKQMRDITRKLRQHLTDTHKGRHPLKGWHGHNLYKRNRAIYKMLKHKFAMDYTNHIAKTNPKFQMTSSRLRHITQPRLDINTQFNEANYDFGANSKMGRENYNLGAKSDKAFADEEKNMTKNYHIISGNKLRRKFGKDPFKTGNTIKRSKYYTLSDDQIKYLHNPNKSHEFSGKTLKKNGVNYNPYSKTRIAQKIDPNKTYKMPYADTMSNMHNHDKIAMQDFKGSDLQKHGFTHDNLTGKKLNPNLTYRKPKYATIKKMKSNDFHKLHPRTAHDLDTHKQEALSDALSRHTHNLISSDPKTGAKGFLNKTSNSFRKGFKLGQKLAGHKAKKIHNKMNLNRKMSFYQDHHGHNHFIPENQMRRISLLDRNMRKHGLNSRQRFNVFIHGNAHDASYLKKHGIKSKGLLNDKPDLAHNITRFNTGFMHPEKGFDKHLTPADKKLGVNLRGIKLVNHQFAVDKHVDYNLTKGPYHNTPQAKYLRRHHTRILFSHQSMGKNIHDALIGAKNGFKDDIKLPYSFVKHPKNTMADLRQNSYDMIHPKKSRHIYEKVEGLNNKDQMVGFSPAKRHFKAMKNGTTLTRRHSIKKLGMKNSFGRKTNFAPRSHSKGVKMRISRGRGLHL